MRPAVGDQPAAYAVLAYLARPLAGHLWPRGGCLNLHHVPDRHRAHALADGAHRDRRQGGEADAARRPWPTPTVRYKTREIPYADIKAIETRREIYGGSVAPVLLKGARLILMDDTPVKLGYGSEADSDPSFPYPEIAHQIAERAGISVTDMGNVRRSAQRKFLGLKKTLIAEPEGTVDESQIAALNASHRAGSCG
jgi:hypothetical protein